jgi:hypothetical protein
MIPSGPPISKVAYIMTNRPNIENGLGNTGAEVIPLVRPSVTMPW